MPESFVVQSLGLILGKSPLFNNFDTPFFFCKNSVFQAQARVFFSIFPAEENEVKKFSRARAVSLKLFRTFLKFFECKALGIP